MSEEKLLTEELAESFLRQRTLTREGGLLICLLEGGQLVDLMEFTHISNEAAEAFAKHKGSLQLDDFELSRLSDAALESLSHKNGEINREDPKEWDADMDFDE